MRVSHLLLGWIWVLGLGPSAWAELTFLSSSDKYATVQLTADSLGVSYTEFTARSVRSTKAVQPGSGFYYFEGTKYVSANIGWAVTTSTPALNAQFGLGDQSVAINTGNGTFWSSNSFQGNIVNFDDTYGIAVDYRGAHPIVHVIGVAVAAGPAVYLGSFTLSAVTTPVYIGVWGLGPGGQLRQTINAGDDLGGHPFRYDPVQVLTEAYYYPISGEDELVLGWGVPDPALNEFPELMLGAPQTVVLGQAVLVSASASDAEDGNLTGSIAYSSDEGPVGSGASFSWTPMALGAHSVNVTITDSRGASRQGTIAVTVISAGTVDNDGDGLSYDQELLLGTHPSLADSDGDGLSDGKEAIYHADPLLADTDGDGRGDLYEALHGTLAQTPDNDADPDGDGFSNQEEADAGSHPLKANATPLDGVVVLDPLDKAAGATLTADGHGVSFAAGKGAAMMAARSSIAISPGTGWFYYEGLRDAAPGDYGFGVATSGEALDHFGGQTNQSLGVFTSGSVYYNNAVVHSFAEVNTTSVYGLAVDYSGANPIVHVIVADANGQPAPIAPTTLTGVSGDLYIFVFGQGGTSARIDGGKDPDDRPFTYPADYELVLDGYAGAEFMGTGWGPYHSYSGRPVPRQFERVFLDPLETPAGADINLGPAQLSCSYTQNLKMAIRANTGMIGQFRYWEANRDTNAGNYGQGYISAHGFLSPYCCVSASLTGAPPSMSINSSAKIWRNLVSQADYDINNTYYGFAVDYRGSRPIVYVILGDALARTLVLDDFFRPIYPMLYGNTQGYKRTNSANFGASAFHYDVRTILGNNGIDTSELILGWGDSNDGETPVISGQVQVLISEDGDRVLSLSDLDVINLGSSKRALSLTAQDGTHYTRSGNTITPDPDFAGNLVVPVSVSDGVFTSAVYDLVIEVTAVNDAPQIDAQAQVLELDEDMTLDIPLTALTVSDVDHSYPDDFTLVILDGANYSHAGTSITPLQDYYGPLSVNVRVNDGSDDSNDFALAVTVHSVNDVPQISGLVAPLVLDEDTSLTIALADLVVIDPDNSYPADFSLSLGDGAHYQRVGNLITPDPNYFGSLSVPAEVSDGMDSSAQVLLAVSVLSVNDIPEIAAQAALRTRRDTAIHLTLDQLTVTDVDNTYPNDFTLITADGSHYTRIANQITPELAFVGSLSVPTRVSDLEDPSPVFNVEIEVCVAPALDTQPLSSAVCVGQPLNLSVVAAGPGPLAYQWRKNGVNLIGQTAASLSIASSAVGDAGSYDCLVSNACDSEPSQVATVTVNAPVSLSQEPVDQTLCPGALASFQVSASGTGPLSYQWRKNSVNIALATAATYTIDDLVEADAGLYDCVVSNACGQLSTRQAELVINGPLEVGIHPSGTAAGLSPLVLTTAIGCALQEVHWEWRDLTRGQLLAVDVDPLVIDPLPSSSTVYQLSVTDELRRETASARIVFLVAPQAQFLDYNGDGCNNIEDLWLLGDDWRELFSNDPNGDGLIDVRDLLYLDTSDQGTNCP